MEETEEERKKKHKCEVQKQWYKRTKAAGICVRCGKEKAMYKSVFCYDCWEKGYDCKQKRVISKEEYERGLQATRIRKRKNLENGLCYKCGKRPHLKGLTTCIDCHTDDMRRSKERSRERKAKSDELRRYRLENHLCTKCGKPAKDGYKTCQYHYDVSIENHKKYIETVKANELCKFGVYE